MSQIEEMMPVSLGKGSVLRIFVDHSKAEDDVGHNWTQVEFDGAEDTPSVTIPAHWHKYHDEIMEITEGRITTTVDGKTFIFKAGDGPLRIARGQVHGFTTFAAERLVATERTTPGGDFKGLFFQDLFGTPAPGVFKGLRASCDGDMYPALPGNFKFLESLFVNVLGFIAKAFVPARPTALKKLDAKQ